jgi:hypothetical protein
MWPVAGTFEILMITKLGNDKEFGGLTAVGAEDWEVQVTYPLPFSWNNNGRLCPV